MRFLAFIEFAAVIVGVIAVIAGHFFALPKGAYLGIFLVGAGITLGGFESVATHRMGFRTSEDQYEVYAGAPAVIFGLMALLIGSGIVANAYLLNDGLWYSTLQHLTRRPAPLLITVGLLIIGVGALMTLNPRGRVGLAWTLLVRAPRWLLGVVLALVGLASIALGVWEWLDPPDFDRFTRSVLKR